MWSWERYVQEPRPVGRRAFDELDSVRGSEVILVQLWRKRSIDTKFRRAFVHAGAVRLPASCVRPIRQCNNVILQEETVPLPRKQPCQNR